ncbi:hypothetical protein BDW75DRAFT_96939 [Aspergillus navahoensis]
MRYRIRPGPLRRLALNDLASLGEDWNIGLTQRFKCSAVVHFGSADHRCGLETRVKIRRNNGDGGDNVRGSATSRLPRGASFASRSLRQSPSPFWKGRGSITSTIKLRTAVDYVGREFLVVMLLVTQRTCTCQDFRSFTSRNRAANVQGRQGN